MTDIQKDLVLKNIDLPNKIINSKRYKITLNPFVREDCLSVGYECLCRAALNYKEENGDAKFETYACCVILWGIYRFILNEYGRGIKISAKEKLDKCQYSDYDINLVQSHKNEIGLTLFLIDLEQTLNKDELELLSLLLDGYSVKQIGQQMNITSSDAYYIFSHLKDKVAKIREAA